MALFGFTVMWLVVPLRNFLLGPLLGLLSVVVIEPGYLLVYIIESPQDGQVQQSLIQKLEDVINRFCPSLHLPFALLVLSYGSSVLYY